MKFGTWRATDKCIYLLVGVVYVEYDICGVLLCCIKKILTDMNEVR